MPCTSAGREESPLTSSLSIHRSSATPRSAMPPRTCPGPETLPRSSARPAQADCFRAKVFCHWRSWSRRCQIPCPWPSRRHAGRPPISPPSSARSARIRRSRGWPYNDGMKLTAAQIEQFDRDGYLFFPSHFSAAEIKALTDEVPQLYAQRRPENVREKGSDAVRTNFAAHMYSAPFARLARHPRMIEPVVQVFGEPVYMHQFKINGKMAFDGDVWQWHQDFGTWFNDDQMPEARAMNVAIFLDDVNEFNGPLMFIPGSHKLGVLDAGHDTTTTSYPLWTIDHATITRRGRSTTPPSRGSSAAAASWRPRVRSVR